MFSSSRKQLSPQARSDTQSTRLLLTARSKELLYSIYLRVYEKNELVLWKSLKLVPFTEYRYKLG